MDHVLVGHVGVRGGLERRYVLRLVFDLTEWCRARVVISYDATDSFLVVGINSAAVHCLSKAINVCSSVIFVFVCAEAITDAIATTNVSISIPVNFFISSNLSLCWGRLDRVEGVVFGAPPYASGAAQIVETSDCFYAVLAAASF